MPQKIKIDIDSETETPSYLLNSDLKSLFDAWKFLRRGVSKLKAACSKERQDIQHRVVDLWIVVFALQVELFDEKRIHPYFVYTRLVESIGDLIALAGELGIHKELGTDGLDSLKSFKPFVAQYRAKASELVI